MIPDGYYDGMVTSATIEENRFDDKQLDAVFDVKIDGQDEQATCAHALEGEYAERTPAVFALLGLDWPGGVNDLAPAVGKPVRVSVKNKVGKKGTEYAACYIVTSQRERKPAPEQKVAAFLARNNADSESEIPF